MSRQLVCRYCGTPLRRHKMVEEAYVCGDNTIGADEVVEIAEEELERMQGEIDAIEIEMSMLEGL